MIYLYIGRDYLIEAPKEQLPWKLSGKRTDKKHNTLEREFISPKEQNSQAKKQMGSNLSAMKKNIQKLIIYRYQMTY